MTKKAELLSARFQGPPQNGCCFLGFFSLLVSLVLLHLASGCSKNPIFIGFLNTLLKQKHLVRSCSNSQLNPQPPVHNLFFSGFFFDQKQLFETLILHHPLKIVHRKNSKNPTFIGSKKVAKLLTLRWPSY